MNKLILFFCCFFSLAHTEQKETIEELKAEVLDGLQDVWGWCSPEKAISFMDLVFETKPKVCVEIGVYAGASALPVVAALHHLEEGIFIAVDPWDVIESIRHRDLDKDKDHVRFWARVNHDQVYFQFIQLMHQFELDKTYMILRSTSKKAAPVIGQIDILHIDGSRYEQSVLEDVKTYGSKVRSGGYIWLNDSSWTTIQPAKALLLDFCDIVKTIDNGNCTLFKKR